MKKAVSILITVCIILCAVPSFYASDIITGKSGDNITYTFSFDTGVFTVTGTGAMYDYAQYWDPPYHWSIQNKRAVKKVVIGEGITRIGSNSFSGFQYAESIQLPESLTEIGENALGSFSRVKSLTLPKNLKRIEYRALCGFSSITSLVLPDSLTYIGENAFEFCSEMTSINIPKNVETIGACLFKDCYQLKNVTVSPENKYFTSDGSCLYRGNELVCLYGNDTQYNMPANITSIYKKAFFRKEALKSVTIAEGITEIPDECFDCCYNLTSVKLPSTLEKIGTGAFSLCEKLETIVIPDSVTTIGKSAFNCCSALNNVDIPASVKRLESGTFSGCSNLYNFTLHEGLEYADAAFWGLPIEEFVMPNSLTGGSVLSGCDKLKRIVFSKKMTEIPDGMLESCNALESIEIPRHITSIGSAFCYCDALKYAVIPETVEHIDPGAFWSCSKFSDVYYYGTEKQWAKLTEPDEYNQTNGTLLAAKVHFLRTRMQDGKIMFTPNDLPNGCTVLFVFERGGKIESIKKAVNNGETIYLDKPESCDSGRVLFLDNEKNIMPICEQEQMRF